VAVIATLAVLGGASPALAMRADEVREWQTGVFAPDKLEHASLAFTSGLGIGVLSRAPAAALGGALALGIVKELWDARRTRFDPGDLAADAVGASLAAVATRALIP
jgi:hypothetical protein